MEINFSFFWVCSIPLAIALKPTMINAYSNVVDYEVNLKFFSVYYVIIEIVN